MTRATPSIDRAARKVRAYAAARDANFTCLGVTVTSGRARILVQPDGGTTLHLTAREAELWLSGYVTGRLSNNERGRP